MKRILLLAAAALSIVLARTDLGMDTIDDFVKCYPEETCWEIS